MDPGNHAQAEGKGMTERRSFVPVFTCWVLLVASSLFWTRAAGRPSQNPAPPPPQTQDISPPVTVEVVQQPTNDPMVAVVMVTVTARVPVTGVTLTVRTPVEVKTDSAQRPLTLALGRPLTVQVRFQASAPGQHR